MRLNKVFIERKGREKLAEHRFNQEWHLSNDQTYSGDADKIMLVWNEYQITPAEQYRKAHFDGIKVDIAICEDPNVQKQQLGDKALIYHFS